MKGIDPVCAGRSAPQVLSNRLNFVGAADGLVLFLEAVYAASGIHELLLTGEERVAARADFHADIALVGGAGLEVVAAGADDVNFVVSGMNSGLHDIAGDPFEIPV